MRILIYEHVCASGPRWLPLWNELAGEGRAMFCAVASDFAALPDCRVTTLLASETDASDLPDCDIRLAGQFKPRDALATVLREPFDAALFIFPEDELPGLDYEELTRSATFLNLSPSAEFIALAADKHATAERLSAAGVNAPQGIVVGWNAYVPDSFPLPAVAKPRYGCGCCANFLVRELDGLIESPDGIAVVKETEFRVEQPIAGRAASVALLCGPAGVLPLAPCWQHVEIGDDGQFRYLGGSLPLDRLLAERAQRLAVAALAAMPAAQGFVGVDLVLGDRADGADDYVIEINPRLTTSYIGLRAATTGNLAAAMLAVARGQMPALRFSDTRIRFNAEGATLHGEPACS